MVQTSESLDMSLSITESSSEVLWQHIMYYEKKESIQRNKSESHLVRLKIGEKT